MNLTGFVLELLLPGAIATIAFLIGLFALLDGKLPIPGTFKWSNGFLGGFVFSICAYLNGIALRHAGQWLWFLHDRHHYSKIIKRDWPALSQELVPIISKELLVAPHGWERETGAGRKDEIGEGLTSYLREYIFANKQQMLSQLIVYQWNLARMARNSFLPLVILALSFVIGIWRPSSLSTTRLTLGLGLGWSLLMSIGVFKAYRDRLGILTGILMRFAAFEFNQRKTTHVPGR